MIQLTKIFSPADFVALAIFIFAWAIYAVTLEKSAFGQTSLNARMNHFRERWMRELLHREMRMVDMQIMSALQNGTAFFASTTLLTIGGALTVLRSTDELLGMVAALPFVVDPSRAQWEIKTLGLTIILVYSFFKFAWAYRLFNYLSILMGAMPPADQAGTKEAEAHVIRTTRLFQSAGRHFNRGQRAFFLALGFLGWYMGPYVLIAATLAVVLVMWRRQFASDGWRALQEANVPARPPSP